MNVFVECGNNKKKVNVLEPVDSFYITKFIRLKQAGNYSNVGTAQQTIDCILEKSFARAPSPLLLLHGPCTKSVPTK